MWQDIMFSLGSWIFAIALIPSIVNKENKPDMKTSLQTPDRKGNEIFKVNV